MSRSDRWCFTVNNPETWRPTWTPSSMNYLVWEMETCPTTGTPHIQGYMRLKTRKRMEDAKRLLCNTAHLELSRGSEESNRAYCSKERNNEDWGEEGEYDPQRKQGKRTDLQDAIKTLKEEGLTKMKEDHSETYVKYHSGLEKLAESLDQPPPLLRTMSVTILWGEPGVGKTWRALQQYPEAYRVRPGRDPFGDYNKEDCILFDEFDPDQWRMETMNEYLDIYRIRLDCRYHNKWARWTKVILISNIDPIVWWQYFPEVKRRAFFRRVSAIYEVENQEQNIEIFTQII